MVVAAVVLALCATGCQVTLAAGIDVRADGSGTVRAGVGFDDEAMAEIGDLGAAFRADDLRAAGWEVVGPAPEDDGLTWLRASRHFDDPDEAAVVAAQLSGPEGPFRDFKVTQERSLFRTRTTFTGVTDLTAGLAGLNDADLQAALGDFDLGLDVEGLKRRFGDALGEKVRVEVSAKLPGKIEAATATVDHGRAVWTPTPGQRIDLVARGDLRRLGPLVYGSLALVVVALGLAAVVLRARQRRRLARR
ncbi:MAG: hypothetical protein QOG43_636 [Actinomycetota bacterium]|jgi:hypothetical protein|nr:hypothetical protein [Actinomycetota bacterium]